MMRGCELVSLWRCCSEKLGVRYNQGPQLSAVSAGVPGRAVRQVLEFRGDADRRLEAKQV